MEELPEVDIVLGRGSRDEDRRARLVDALEIGQELGLFRSCGAPLLDRLQLPKKSLQLDRKPLPLESCRFEHGDQVATFGDVDADNSVLMRKGEAVTVSVLGQKLRPGRRTLGVNVVVKDMGTVSFSVTDQAR